MNMIRAAWGHLEWCAAVNCTARERATEDTAHRLADPGRDRCRVPAGHGERASKVCCESEGEGAGASRFAHPRVGGHVSDSMGSNGYSKLPAGEGAQPIVATPVRVLGPGHFDFTLGQNCASNDGPKC